MGGSARGAVAAFSEVAAGLFSAMAISRWRGGRYCGLVAAAPHSDDVHRLVDMLPAGQIEALYVLLRGMLPERGESPQSVESTRSLEEWSPSPEAPVVRRLSVAGVARGDHDLAARSQEILRAGSDARASGNLRYRRTGRAAQRRG
jgi:hypothetical protein